jgi:anti-sigma factor RsiW
MNEMTRIDDVMLMAYVDGEIDVATAREIETRLAVDPALAQQVRTLRDSAATARAAFNEVLHEPIPDRLMATITKAPIRAESSVVSLAERKQGRANARVVVGWALAASLAALVLGSTGTYMFMGGSLPIGGGVQLAAADRWLDQVGGIHGVLESTLRTNERLLVDFGAEHIEELEKWFGTKMDRSLSVPDLSAFGFMAQGGRILVIGGRPAAQFVYRSNAGELIALVVASTNQGDQAGRAAKRGNANIVHWREKGYAYAFVGTIDSDRLWSMADASWKALRTI